MNDGRFTVLLIVVAGLALIEQRAFGDDPDLAAWWSFDTDVQEGVEIVDDTGNGNEALRSGGTLVPDGITGQAMSFDGVDDYLFVPQGVEEGNNVGNFGTNDFAICFWMKTDSNYLIGVMGKREHCHGVHSFIDMRMTDRLYSPLCHNDTVLEHCNILNGLRQINDGLWHYVVITREGTTASLYVDGRLDQQQTQEPLVYIFNSADFEMGRSACYVSGTDYYPGLLDEVRVFNRAMDCAEVRADFEAFFDVLDFNRDESVDVADVFYMTNQWLQTGARSPLNYISPADVAPGCGDGTVNFFDYAALAESVND